MICCCPGTYPCAGASVTAAAAADTPICYQSSLSGCRCIRTAACMSRSTQRWTTWSWCRCVLVVSAPFFSSLAGFQTPSAALWLPVVRHQSMCCIWCQPARQSWQHWPQRKAPRTFTPAQVLECHYLSPTTCLSCSLRPCAALAALVLGAAPAFDNRSSPLQRWVPMYRCWSTTALKA